MRNSCKEIIAVGASAFIPKCLAERLKKGMPPLVGRQIVESALGPSPLISTPSEIARDNAGSGVTVFVIHNGLSDPEGSLQHQGIVKAQLLTAFLALHQGYHVSEIIVEAYGREERSIYEATDFRLISDYSSFQNWALLPTAPGSPRPALLGLAREDALVMKTNVLLPIFVYRRPKCGFSLNEQQLLHEALAGRTDDELAATLNISLSAVKKRWIRVFEKAERVMPELRFLDHTANSHLGRRTQRRHILLRNIRNCPEELTPFPPHRRQQV